MIEIRTYEGDAAELSRFTRGVWRQSYEGRMLVPLWEPDYLDWQLLAERPGGRDFLVAAYDGKRLIGTDLATTFRFRLRGRELDCTLRSWFTVHPDYRRRGAAIKLVNEQRRRHLERGVPLSLGFLYAGWSGSLGPKFFLQRSDHVVVRKVGFWARLLDHRAVATGDLSRLKGLGARALGLLQGRPPARRPADDIRPYRAGDLSACVDLARGLLRGMDLGCVWTSQLLAHQLDYKNVPRTFVIEKQGDRIGGFLNYHRLDAMGRHRIETALIDIAAFSELSHRDRKDLLRAALCQMADDGIKVVLMLRLPSCPRRALLASGFVPMPSELYVISRSFEHDLSAKGLKRLQMPCR